MKFQQTLTERQCEFGQRTGSKSLIPVIVPMYLESNIIVSEIIYWVCFTGKTSKKSFKVTGKKNATEEMKILKIR